MGNQPGESPRLPADQAAQLLDQGVLNVDSKGGVRIDPPPRANADLIISTLCYLSENEKYIASGPAAIKPINVSPQTRWVLWGVFVIGLPLLVVGVGLGVMFLRKR